MIQVNAFSAMERKEPAAVSRVRFITSVNGFI